MTERQLPFRLGVNIRSGSGVLLILAATALAHFTTLPVSGQILGGRSGNRQELNLIQEFDKDGDKFLNEAERAAAREFLADSGLANRNARRAGYRVATPTGVRLTPADVPKYTNTVYDPGIVRTFFLEFADPDWEDEMAAFKDTDVHVPAKVTVDGQVFMDVGVQFRGNSSYNAVSPGLKRALSLSFDVLHDKQSFGGYSSLNFLNANEDPTFLRSFLFSRIARDYIPVPKVNHVRVVINGESWGIYVNQQAFDKDFLKDHFGSKEGARWKVPGIHRMPSGGWYYLGNDPASYQDTYMLKSKEDPQAWNDFINACKLLSTTPSAKLEVALGTIIDIDEVLKFLAIDNALSNRDGFWTKGSDYCIYESGAGKFQVVPHDFNETFRVGRDSGSQLDPLVLAGDTYKPIASKLLAVPALRTKYLGYVHNIAEKWLDWKRLGPVVQKQQALIAADVAKDTHKLYSTQAFKDGVSEEADLMIFGFVVSSTGSLRSFVEQRREYLLNYTTRLHGE